MLYRLRFLLLICAVPATLGAQTFKAYVKAGAEALARKDYQAAMQHYNGALTLKPDAHTVSLQYATVALKFHAYQQAAEHFQKVLDSPKGDDFPEALLGLGEVYQHTGAYSEAVGYLTAFLKREAAGTPARLKAERLLEQCRWAKTQKLATLVKTTHLGRSVNTDYSEFAPLLYNDTFYYSSFRYERSEDDYDPVRRITKVLYRKGQSRGRPLRRGFNDDQLHTAHTTFSLDGSRVYFTRCDYVSASEIRCQIAFREREGKGRWDRKAQLLPDAINRKDFTATHPSIGYDSTAQTEVLFFVSEGPGGDLDLFRAPIDTAGQAGQPEPLKDLNTEQDDLTPFFHTPTQTLYFSSAGRENFGGYDIFRAVWTPAGWSSPKNLGQPVNSSYNDLYYSLPEDTTLAYLASNRTGAYYLDDDFEACCNDLYAVQYLPPPDTTALAKIPPEPVQPVPVVPEPVPVPTTLQDFLPLALYFDNDEPDKRTRRTTTQQTYGDTYESYSDRKSDYLDNFADPLEADRQEEATFAVETFFEQEVEKGYQFLGRFSEILLQRLERGDTVEIFMKGYTSPRAKRDYNLALSKRRISSVRNHFRTYQEGVFLPYLSAGQLVLSERPFGEAEAANTVSDALDDLRNSIYHPDAARERRVEIVEIRD
ncbi:MAG: hypothetical protein RIC19_15925 [Phaeodactylibacter sp.]|uniref:hypothetical protein n=1 Tax=Phaeodactylibacter sp. TaxID=1940289 RepID=UPI0032EBA415